MDSYVSPVLMVDLSSSHLHSPRPIPGGKEAKAGGEVEEQGQEPARSHLLLQMFEYYYERHSQETLSTVYIHKTLRD